MKVVNIITDRKITPSGKMKGKTPEQRYEHFRKHLGTPEVSPSAEDISPVHHDVNIKNGEFTPVDLKEANKQLRYGKAPGEDGIMPELLKAVNIDNILLSISNKFYMENQMPEQLGILNLVPLPKSGDLTKTGTTEVPL